MGGKARNQIISDLESKKKISDSKKGKKKKKIRGDPYQNWTHTRGSTSYTSTTTGYVDTICVSDTSPKLIHCF